jgi:hypothetical protein
VDFTSGDGNFLDLSFLHLVEEFGKGNLLLAAPLAGSDHGEQQHDQANDNYPKNQCLDIRIHETSAPGLSFL